MFFFISSIFPRFFFSYFSLASFTRTLFSLIFQQPNNYEDHLQTLSYRKQRNLRNFDMKTLFIQLNHTLVASFYEFINQFPLNNYFLLLYLLVLGDVFRFFDRYYFKVKMFNRTDRWNLERGKSSSFLFTLFDRTRKTFQS